MEINEIFNKARIANLNIIMDRKKLKETLKNLPVSKLDPIITELINRKAILKIGKNKYMFTNFPIHRVVFDRIFTCLKERQKRYQKTYYQKKKSKDPVEECIEMQEAICNAIQLLKSTGEYEIYRLNITKTKL